MPVMATCVLVGAHACVAVLQAYPHMIVGSVPWLMSQHEREGIVYNNDVDAPGLGLSLRPAPPKRSDWLKDLRGHRDDFGKKWEFMLALPRPTPMALLQPRVYKPYEPRTVPVPMPKGTVARLEAKKAALVRASMLSCAQPLLHPSIVILYHRS